ncbi:MAG: TVP38/TMEM64 family protein [Nitrospinaceae bacterium]|nr:MAG: TVP38/TMEM64 family protein [Nitrospinaceae bacterium]
MRPNSPATWRQQATAFIFGGNPKRRFISFIIIILVGLITSYLTVRKGVRLTPESFRDFVVSLGIAGPLIYTGVFVIRPLLLIPSIALFIGGGLAFGPVWGPVYASVGAAMGGTVGFWIARRLGRDYVKSKLKFGAGVIDNTKFSFSVVWLLSLIPVMPVTVINYGAGLSNMKFGNYITAHVLGLTPRAFAYGFFGSTLLEIGSPRFRGAVMMLLLLGLVTVYFRLRRNRIRNGINENF